MMPLLLRLNARTVMMCVCGSVVCLEAGGGRRHGDAPLFIIMLPDNVPINYFSAEEAQAHSYSHE